MVKIEVLAKQFEWHHLMAKFELQKTSIKNIELLLKRLRIAGLPDDVVNLIEIWLKDRTYYVTAKGTNSYIRLSDIGTIQGSILGPFLYAIYVAPIQDLYKITNTQFNLSIKDTH